MKNFNTYFHVLTHEWIQKTTLNKGKITQKLMHDSNNNEEKYTKTFCNLVSLVFFFCVIEQESTHDS